MLKKYLNTIVNVNVDRPINSRHPKYNFTYTLNYGFVPNTVSGDNEEIDAYILDVNKPLKTFKGKVIAIIHRLNDVEDKLVVVDVSNLKKYSKEEILKAVNFQERYFEIEVII